MSTFFENIRRYFTRIRLNKNEKYLQREIENERSERLQLARNFRYSENEHQREIEARRTLETAIRKLRDEWIHELDAVRLKTDKDIKDLTTSIEQVKTRILHWHEGSDDFTNDMQSALELGRFTATLDGIETVIRYEIRVSFEAILFFRLHNRSYEMRIRKWRKLANQAGRPFNTFAVLMLSTFGKHTTDFGTVDAREDCTVYKFSVKEARNMIRYALFDLIRCIDAILADPHISALEYASYFCNKQSFETYRAYIHSVSCICIEECKLSIPRQEFKLVEFSDEFNYNAIDMSNSFEHLHRFGSKLSHICVVNNEIIDFTL